MGQDRIYVNWGRKRAIEDGVIALSPVGYWRLGEASGTSMRGRFAGRHGTYVNTPTLGAAGALSEDAATAVTFNGTDEYGEVPDHATLDLADSWSMFALVKRGPTGAVRTILSKGTGAYNVRVNAAGAIEVSRSNVATIVASTVTLDTNWHAIFAGKSGSTVRIELDGKDVTGTVTDSTMVDNALSLTIGADQTLVPAKEEFFNGSLQDVALWGRLLSTAESARLASAFLFQEFGGPFDDITAWVEGTGKIRRSVGRNAEGSSDQPGLLDLECDNSTGLFARFRNLATNPDFIVGIDDWETSAIASVTAAATSLAWWDDPYTGAGSRNARAVLSGSANSGIWLPIPGTFRNGVPITVEAALKSYAGNTNVELGIASRGTPANLASSGGTISGTYALKSATLTPSADRSDLAVFVRTHTTAATATVGLARVQVNIGSTAYTFVFGPSDEGARPGGTILWTYTDDSAVVHPRFYGLITRIAEEPETLMVSIHAEDARSSHNVDIAVSAGATTTHADWRREVLDAAIRAVEGGYRNLAINPSFEDPHGTTGWTLISGTAISSVWASVGTKSALVAVGGQLKYSETSPNPVTGKTFYAGRYYRATVKARASSGTATALIVLGSGEPEIMSMTTTEGEYSVIYRAETTTDQAPQLWIIHLSGSSFYVDALMLTEGLPLRSYLDPSTARGRQPEFARGIAWHHGWDNREPNPELVTDTSGWSTSTNGFVTVAGATFARSTVGLGGFGTNFSLITDTIGKGVRSHYGATFRAGRTYRVRVYAGGVNGAGSAQFKYGIGSRGATSDKSEITVNQGDAEGWREWSWTPAADRTDAAFYCVCSVVSGGTTTTFTAVMVSPDDPSEYARDGVAADEADTITTPSAGVTRVKTFAVSSSGAMLESAAWSDLGALTVTAMIQSVSGSTSIKLGVGDPYGTATDSSSTALTISATPNRYSHTWTPSTVSRIGHPVNVFAVAGGAAVAEFDIWDVQLYWGVASQSIDPPQADGIDDAETDLLAGGRTLENAAALSELAAMNEADLGVHWIEPTLTRPFWVYRSRARVSLPGRSVDHVLDDLTSVIGFADAEQDGADVYQATAVRYRDGGWVADADENPVGVGTFRVLERDGDPYIDINTASAVSGLLFLRHRVPRSHPTVVITEANLDLLLGIDVDDLCSLDSRRARLWGYFLVVSLVEEVTQGGRSRELAIELEEYPY